MKTKFILHGGFAKGKTDEDNSKFYTEILKDAPGKAKVLLVCFAKDDDRILDATTRVMAEFNKNKWQKEITFEIANNESFLEQIKSSDVIYFNGGRTLKLLDVLKKFPDFRNLFDGKIVVGESAGANVLARYFYSPNADSVGEGLGFLPIKIIPHYAEQYKGKLNDVGKDLEELDLHEYEYKVFNHLIPRSSATGQLNKKQH